MNLLWKAIFKQITQIKISSFLCSELTVTYIEQLLEFSTSGSDRCSKSGFPLIPNANTTDLWKIIL